MSNALTGVAAEPCDGTVLYLQHYAVASGTGILRQLPPH
ncbi:hypothetical protein LMG27174_06860 [Paraburkholderia rhynchosiae]|uniref:Uncharacterized protein n=1 Tax=Paraburkholderia rhynchosiae TaxID=487049 RepID=A0A6J5CQG6_9BURK|nr:hypothetical protein LMG27174_06860 [Paraburkholderia rhynchosiae]